MNVALADAVNLGWKLAATVYGHAPDGLLETYHQERHEAGARVLRTTRTQSLLGRGSPGLDPVREFLGELTELPSVGKNLAELVTGVNTRYAPRIPGDHPWLGKLAPNLTLIEDGKRTTVAELLTPARPLFLTPGTRALPAGIGEHVETHHAHCPDHPDLEGLLIRPDGHTAWISTTTAPQPDGTLATALTTWFTPRT